MKTLPIDDHNQGIFFHKLGHFFPIFEKEQGRPIPPPPLQLRACKCTFSKINSAFFCPALFYSIFIVLKVVLKNFKRMLLVHRLTLLVYHTDTLDHPARCTPEHKTYNNASFINVSVYTLNLLIKQTTRKFHGFHILFGFTDNEISSSYLIYKKSKFVSS